MRPNTFPALRQLRRAPSTLCKSAQPLSSRRSSTSTAASKPNNGSYRKVAPKSVNPITKPAVYSNRSTRPTTNFVGMSVEDVDTTLDPLPTIPTPAPSSSSSGPSPTTPAGDSFVQAVQTTSPSYSNGNGSASGGGDGSIDWSSSFHGLSTTAFEPSVAAILMAPVATDDVEIKPDGIAYLPEIKYRRILNTAFGPGGWGLAPRGELVVGEKVVTREYALVVHGRLVAFSLCLYAASPCSLIVPFTDVLRVNQIRGPGPGRVPVLQRGHDPHRRRGVQEQRAVAVLQGPGHRVGAVGPEVPEELQEAALPRGVGRARRQQEEEADLDAQGHGAAVPLCAG